MKLRLLPLVLLLALAGCGSSSGEAPSASQTRSIETAMGPVDVPADPQRVVVLDSGELDLAASLGVQPVGVATADGAVEEVQPYLAETAQGAERVGTNVEPDLERIAALRPDLIIGTKVRVEALYDKLSAIAPTVLGETPAAWKDNVRLHGDALGKAEEADAKLREIERRAAAIGESLGDPADTTVAMLRFLPGEIRLYGPESFVGSILTDVGVSLPPTAAAVKDDISATLSLEVLDEASADVMYVSTYGDPGDTDQAAAQQLGTWDRLPAVRSGRTYPVDDDVWMLGIGPTGAGMVLDDLERTLER